MIAVCLRRLGWAGAVTLQTTRQHCRAAAHIPAMFRSAAESHAFTTTCTPSLRRHCSTAPAKSLIRQHQPRSHNGYSARCPFLAPALLRHGLRENPSHRLTVYVTREPPLLPVVLCPLPQACCHLRVCNGGGRLKQRLLAHPARAPQQSVSSSCPMAQSRRRLLPCFCRLPRSANADDNKRPAGLYAMRSSDRPPPTLVYTRPLLRH
jgi:hypothetical protein